MGCKVNTILLISLIIGFEVARRISWNLSLFSYFIVQYIDDFSLPLYAYWKFNY